MSKWKKIIVILLVVMTVMMTGCTKMIKKDGKTVQNPETGQNLPSNILCQPEAKKTIEKYNEHNIDISKLPKCEEFNVTSGGYEGIWTTMFVKPLAWLIIKIGSFAGNYGISIIIITLIIRLVLMPITRKTAMQSENMKKVQPELAKLEKKYANKRDQESNMQKSQEMLLLYKKYDINPMAGCLFSFIQIPLFFAFYEALNRLPAIFEENLGPFQLGTSPYKALISGHYYYIIFVILVIAVTYFSFKLNSGASMSVDQAKQMKMMTNIMVVFISVASFSISSAIALYWIFNSGFTIIQNLWVKRGKKNVVKV